MKGSGTSGGCLKKVCDKSEVCGTWACEVTAACGRTGGRGWRGVARKPYFIVWKKGGAIKGIPLVPNTVIVWDETDYRFNVPYRCSGGESVSDVPIKGITESLL